MRPGGAVDVIGNRVLRSQAGFVMQGVPSQRKIVSPSLQVSKTVAVALANLETKASQTI